jgi:hypothetical protein
MSSRTGENSGRANPTYGLTRRSLNIAGYAFPSHRVPGNRAPVRGAVIRDLYRSQTGKDPGSRADGAVEFDLRAPGRAWPGTRVGRVGPGTIGPPPPLPSSGLPALGECRGSRGPRVQQMRCPRAGKSGATISKNNLAARWVLGTSPRMTVGGCGARCLAREIRFACERLSFGSIGPLPRQL